MQGRGRCVPFCSVILRNRVVTSNVPNHRMNFQEDDDFEEFEMEGTFIRLHNARLTIDWDDNQVDKQDMQLWLDDWYFSTFYNQNMNDV